jgi:hypothetical protein
MKHGISGVGDIIDNFDTKRHLSFLFSVAMEYLYTNDKKIIDNINFKVGLGYKLCKHEKSIIRNKENYGFYPIVPLPLKGDEISREKFGSTTLFKRGAVIMYPYNLEHRLKHIIIAHEIGHILLHTERGEDHIRRFSVPKTEEELVKREAEATYFAETILRNRSLQLKDGGFLTEIVYDNEDDIRAEIKSVLSNYEDDLKLL